MNPAPARRVLARPDRLARAGFSFIEILVVMAIIAVLVGIGIGIYVIVIRKMPETKTQNLVNKMRANVDHFKGHFKMLPPSDFARMGDVLGPGAPKLGRPTPANATNAGIEALYQALHAPGFGHNSDLSDAEISNTDDDRLDKAFDTKSGDLELHEVLDAYGAPLVYFIESEYTTAEKNPPTYIKADGEPFSPKPWRVKGGSGFAQPSSFQLFSIGADGVPNTDDDIKYWD